MWQPADLEGYGFLELNPIGLGVDDIWYKGDSAWIKVMLIARPEVLSAPSGKKPLKLPNLSEYGDREGFDITTDVYLEYDSLSSVLSRDFNGMEIPVGKKRKVILGDIGIHGASGKQLSIEVNFSGTKSGKLYLIGTPVFDVEKQHISFPDLVFDVKSKSALLKGAKWFFDGKINERLRKEASMDITPHLDILKKEIQSSLNGYLDEGIYMWGSVKKMRIDLIHPLEDKLHVRLNSTGKIGIKVD